VQTKKRLYGAYIWQPCSGLSVQTRDASCRVYLHLATNVCSYAYPSSTARSLFFATNKLALHFSSCGGTPAHHLRDDSREGCGLRAHVSPKYLYTRVHRKVWAMAMNPVAQDPPTADRCSAAKRIPCLFGTHASLPRSQQTATDPYTPLHPSTTLPNGIFSSRFVTKLLYALLPISTVHYAIGGQTFGL
jgi:hypothetical protein